MYHYFKRAISDIFSNRFLNFVTIVTIALSILVVSTFALFFENVNRLLDSWHRGLKVVAYLDQNFVPSMLPGITAEVQTMGNAGAVRFISKDDALETLKVTMGKGKAMLDTLEENPLPHALEITIDPEAVEWSGVAALAKAVERLPHVESVEYGQRWLGRFLSLIAGFKVVGYAMGGLFFMITLFITANTVGLVFYSRSTEVEIMRLVGATDRFIATPFYLEGFIQGALGGILGLIILSVVFFVIPLNPESIVSSEVMFDLQFLSVKYLVIIIAGSAFLGWLGCYLSLRKFLKY